MAVSFHGVNVCQKENRKTTEILHNRKLLTANLNFWRTAMVMLESNMYGL